MRLEHYDVEKLKRELLGLIGTYVNLSTHRVFFFGSRVADPPKGDDRSDIDVGVEGPTPIPPGMLGSITAAVESIPTLLHIDVVDFTTVSKEFRDVALQHIEVISEPAAGHV